MLKDKRIVLIPILSLALFFIIFILYALFTKPEKKPLPQPYRQEQWEQAESSESPEPSETTSDKEVFWFIEFTAKNQKTTAYTEESYAPKAASGNNYRLGTVAVHPLYPLQYGGSAIKPLIPFGTIIYLQEPIEVHGQWYDALVVNDTGDVNYRLWSNSPYWLDVYIGTANSYNRKAAQSYGIKAVDYTWYEPWIEN